MDRDQIWLVALLATAFVFLVLACVAAIEGKRNAAPLFSLMSLGTFSYAIYLTLVSL